MKKLIAVLLIICAVHLQAAPYFPGAWFITKAPERGMRQAGGLEVIFYGDNTLEFDIYLGGGYLETVDGTYERIFSKGVLKYYVFTVTDSDGWTWTGKLNVATLQLVGTFRNATGIVKGKWQATREDDGQSE
jgi:hypothetical protein